MFDIKSSTGKQADPIASNQQEQSIRDLYRIKPEKVVLIRIFAITRIEKNTKIPRVSEHYLFYFNNTSKDIVCAQERYLAEEKLIELAIIIVEVEVHRIANKGLQTLCTSGDSGSSALQSKASIPKGQNLAIKTDSEAKGIDRFNQQSKVTSSDSNSGELK